jgi:hypothetical protein
MPDEIKRPRPRDRSPEEKKPADKPRSPQEPSDRRIASPSPTIMAWSGPLLRFLKVGTARSSADHLACATPTYARRGR